MDLKKLQDYWKGFPEISMEERPLLSSDLEKMTLHNPFSGVFDLRSKLLARIITGSIIWLLAASQLRISWRTESAGLYQQALALLILSYFIYFHVRLLLFADYPALAGLRLIPFLGKIETVMEKYMHSFRIISILAAFYSLAAFEKLLSLFNSGAAASLSGSTMYKWLIIIFLAVSFHIVFLNTGMQKYKKLMLAVRSYREGIILAKPQIR